jgi:hypothetical protein
MRRTLLAAAMVMALAIAPSVASAQSGAEILGQADAAYGEVDFERARTLAEQAIQAGGLSPQELVHAYQLVGVSASALGDAAASRQAFLLMVEIDPDARLDDTVPPRLRAPFLEARGMAGSHHGRLAAEVQLARAYSALRITLTDPFDIVTQIRLHSRVEGQVEFATSEHEPDDEIMARASGASSADRMEYWLEALDEHGNRVLMLGSEFEPRVVGRIAAAAGGGGGGGGGDEGGGGGGGPGIFGEPAFWIVVGAVVAVGAGVGIGFAVDAQNHVQLGTGVRFGIE